MLTIQILHAAFNKLHAHGHSGIKISIEAFHQFYFLPYSNEWMSIFIHDFIECQENKHNNQKFKQQQYKPFQKMLHISITEYQLIQKDL